MRILLAGGAVRDRLLGRPESDRDYLVLDTDREAFARRFPRAKEVGKAFPVFILEGREYAFPRGPDLDSDLLGRDFTVNALAQEEDGTLHAHPLALQDIQDRVLRPASDRSLSDDPLRVYRAARFLAQMEEFVPHPDLLAAMGRAASRGLPALAAPDRVGAELRKALRAPRPGRFLDLLARTDCLRPWFPELAGAAGVPAGPAPFHHTHLLGHTMEVMDRLAGNELAAYMALSHDLGKALTPQDQWPRHIGHEKAGEAPALALGERLRLPASFIRAGGLAARRHLLAARYAELRPGTRVDLLMELHSAGITEEMFLLARADHDTDHLEKALADTRTILQVRLEEQDRNKGQESGDKLRQLRAMALARRG